MGKVNPVSKDERVGWGGGSTQPLTALDVRESLCCVMGCGRKGFAAIFLESDGVYRPMCAEHLARLQYLNLVFIGDPDAALKWRWLVDRLANVVGVGDDGMLGVGIEAVPATAVSTPAQWRCEVCGSGMSGSGSIQSWFHRCIVDG